MLRILRDGDVLVVTLLDRLGRSVLHLVILGAQLRDRAVGLQRAGKLADRPFQREASDRREHGKSAPGRRSPSTDCTAAL